MMRSPYKSPKEPPSKRFLRLPRPEKKTRKRQFFMWAAAIALGFLVYSFIGGQTGLIRIRALQSETQALRTRKVALATEAERVDQNRENMAKDPLVTERVARERFHMVKKGEILYRYQEEDSAR
ncbi:MAG TPA: septum formation initiator family protein [Candidatus Dormibacteraeota bacterium]|nr:septum formation initiator family protein [Candidatus Dormibacteraeota bacterium]